MRASTWLCSISGTWLRSISTAQIRCLEIAPEIWRMVKCMDSRRYWGRVSVLILGFNKENMNGEKTPQKDSTKEPEHQAEQAVGFLEFLRT